MRWPGRGACRTSSGALLSQRMEGPPLWYHASRRSQRMPQPTQVFFSYPHADQTFATRLAKSLQEEGLELDRVDSSVPAVRNGIEQLEKRVLSAGSVVLLINPRSKFDEAQQR